MRRQFVKTLDGLMEEDEEIILIPLDVGFGVLDPLMKKYPNRVQNHGISEQHAVSLATGMALAGKKPFIYSIGSFLLFRGLEQIRLLADMNKEKSYAPVVLVATGIDEEYTNFGITHYSTGDTTILSTMPLKVHTPLTKEAVHDELLQAYREGGTHYIRLSRY